MTEQPQNDDSESLVSAPSEAPPAPKIRPLNRVLLATASLTAAGIIVALIEMIRLAWTGENSPAMAAIGAGAYLWGIVVVCVVASVVNLFPVAVGVGATASHGRWRRGLGLGGAGIFAALWHSTTMQGDGIQAHDMYLVIYYASLVAMMVGLMSFVYFLILPGRISLKSRRQFVGASLMCSLFFSISVLPGYVAFHGHLVAFEAMLIAWLIYPWLRVQYRKSIVAASIVIGVLSVGTLWGADGSCLRYVQRYASLPRSLMLAFPPSRLLLTRHTGIFGGASSTEKLRDTVPLALREARGSIDSESMGKNVLVIVLESTRADAWQNKDVTPRFHQWKRHGVYFPRAVANYPATPLAYGAIFTSQPPSVLVQTPHWSDPRLFDVAHNHFDHFLLSQPNTPWFDHTAITQFFMPQNLQPHRHDSAKSGLNATRKAIEQVGDESFFGWIHLYEPHAPYDHRPGHGDEGGPGKAYASEIRYIDAQLGAFMDWFYAQPVAAETLVVIIGDHGEGISEEIDATRFWGHHVHVDNFLSHVPAYFSGPGLPADTTRLAPGIDQLDVAPTILDFIGEKPASGTYPQGWSLYKLLERKPTRPLVTQAFSIRGKRFFDFVGKARADEEETNVNNFKTVLNEGRYSPKIALQYGAWKLHYDVTLDHFELFNMEKDPQERNDLAPSHPEQLAEMVERLRSWHYRQRWVVDAFNQTSAASSPASE